MSDTTTRRLLVDEVSERLRCPKERVLRLIRAGLLRGINAGLGTKRPRYVVDAADLEAFERVRATAPAAVEKKIKRRQQESVPNYFTNV
ncbi:MAG TPA: hypothetical protein VKI65_12560 [Gemmataceae bacterium]|nr:hypothetical protein [Gemmataceae bacterium]